jgi:porin
MFVRWALLSLPALLLPVAPVVADPLPALPAQVSPPPETLTGEWGGLRTWLRNAGIDLTAGYRSEVAGNVSGGARRDVTEAGQFTFGVTLDTAALAGLDGGTVQLSITRRRGPNVDQKAGLGTLQEVQGVYGRGRTWRLTELWYQQSLARGLDIKIGRLAQGTDFGSFPCMTESLAFCAPLGNIDYDDWYSWPISQWGARLRLTRRNWYVMAAAYESNPNNLKEGFALSHGGATGVLAPIEFGWTPRLGPAALPGSYRVGVWYNSADANDVLLGADHRPFAITGMEPLRRDGRRGFYLMFQQQLTGRWRNDPAAGPVATHGLSLFLNVMKADHRSTYSDLQVAAGLFFAGPLAARPQDDLGVAIARTKVNGRAALSDILADPTRGRPDAEYETEIYYSVVVRPWLTIRPSVQYVADPGGYDHAKGITVLGVKNLITF